MTQIQQLITRMLTNKQWLTAGKLRLALDKQYPYIAEQYISYRVAERELAALRAKGVAEVRCNQESGWLHEYRAAI